MNNIFRKLNLTVIACCLFVAAHAQSPQDVMNSMKANRVADIVKYIDNIVPITINNASNTYSRTQAEMVLKDFFAKNPPRDINIVNSGNANGNSKFAIGDLTTENGKYSVYILMREKRSNEYQLQEMRINKE